MKKLLLFAALTLLTPLAGFSQSSLPKGASKFITELGGFSISRNNRDILLRIAGNKIDKVESGGGVLDWTKLDGRVFLRTAWTVDIGQIAPDYNTYDLEQALAAEMQRRLESEGFRLTPKKFNFHYVRYEKGSTVGTVEVRSFFLGSGNPPYHIEIIFNESYRRARNTGKTSHR